MTCNFTKINNSVKIYHLIFRRVGWQNEMVEKFRQIIGNSAKHCLAFSAGTWPQTILPRISQSTLVQAALRETYCVTKTSNSTRRQKYRSLSCPYIQRNQYETALNFIQLHQNLTWECLLIQLNLPVFTSFCMVKTDS